jgi:hypothetical protein
MTSAAPATARGMTAAALAAMAAGRRIVCLP